MKGYHKDTHALNSLKQTAEFVLSRINTLQRVAPGLEKPVREAAHHLRNNTLPPPWQMTKLEAAYEKIIAAITGEKSVGTFIDRKRKGLRYG